MTIGELRLASVCLRCVLCMVIIVLPLLRFRLPISTPEFLFTVISLVFSFEVHFKMMILLLCLIQVSLLMQSVVFDNSLASTCINIQSKG